MTDVTTTDEARAFFAEHAGLSVKPGESHATARERCARELAEAEAWADEHGLGFDVEPDPDLGSATDEQRANIEAGETVYLQAALIDESEVVGSLGGIEVDAETGEDDPYMRVVRAELADEYRRTGGERRMRLREIAEDAMDIYDETTAKALKGGDVPRYCLVTSEGSDQSSYADNPNVTVHETLSALASAAADEIGGGWTPKAMHDLETGEEVGWHERVEVEGTIPGYVSVESVIEALRDAHCNDSAADAVEFVSDLVGWSAEDDPEMRNRMRED